MPAPDGASTPSQALLELIDTRVEKAIKAERARLAEIVENMWPPEEGEFNRFLEELAQRILYGNK